MTSAAVSTRNLRSGPMMPTSMLLPETCPSKPSLSVSSAVWMASSMPMSSLYRFSRNVCGGARAQGGREGQASHSMQDRVADLFISKS